MLPYIAPEVKVGYAITSGVTLDLGLSGIGMFGADHEAWGTTSDSFHAGNCPNNDPNQCQGLAALKQEKQFSSFVFGGGPFAGISAAF